MYRFYRRHYAPERSALVNAAVYAGIWGKLALSVPRGVIHSFRERGRVRP